MVAYAPTSGTVKLGEQADSDVLKVDHQLLQKGSYTNIHTSFGLTKLMSASRSGELCRSTSVDVEYTTQQDFNLSC